MEAVQPPVVERFLVERLAASGGMGRVYRARDADSGEAVALKVLDARGAAGTRSRALERFAREARLLAQLRHPGIVRFIAFGTTPRGEPYLAMEWIDGETLAARLSRGPLSLQETLALTTALASALATAHAAGIVHRDIKPSNVLLADGDVARAKIIDFGIARFAPLASDVTRPGGVLGTPGYMAPEQARALRDIDARADVYALGCVVFRCVTGRLPFEGDDALSVLAKILLERTPRVREFAPGVSPSLDDLVARMLAKEPAGRPADGAVLVGELAALDIAVDPAASRNVRPPALGEAEQRFVSLVVVPGGTAVRADTDEPTLVEDTEGAPARIANVVGRFGCEIEWLADGSLVAVLAGYGSATDQAAQAARCALALRQVLPREPIVLATGRAERAAGTGGAPVGEVIDRAAKLAQRARAGSVRPDSVLVDEVTAGLLDSRFDVSGLELCAEREPTDATRSLLGRPVPCIGRDHEVATLLSLIDACCEERAPRAVLVTAGAGVGKSRLRHELVRQLRARGDDVEVWTARGDPMSAGAPFGMVAQVLRRALGLVEGEPASARRRKLRARVARHVAPGDRDRVVEFLGELVGAPGAEESVELRVARQDPMLMGDQLRRAWETFLAGACATRPVLVVLEDLHWGDVPSVRFFDAALALERTSLAVLALARPEVHDVFPRLWSERAMQELRLAPLGRRASETLVRHALGDTVTQGMVERIVERAAGNAFYLEELVRAAQSEGGDALPETVLAMVQARLDRLEADERRLLRGASVYGRTFWRGGAAALLGDGGEGRDSADLRAVDATLDRLVARELVSRRASSTFANEVEYAFRHEIVREAAYAMLTDRDRRAGHALAAAWLESRGEPSALVLAEHWERGGDRARALVGYERAAAQALEGNDFDATVARAERGIACGAYGDRLGRLRLLQAEAQRWRGDLRASRTAALEAFSLIPTDRAAWFETAGLLGLMSSALGDIGWVISLAERIAGIGPAALSRDAQSAYLVAAGRVASQLFYSGNGELGSRLLAHVDAELPRCHPDPTALAALAFARGVRAVTSGDYSAALDGFREARVRYESAGDVRSQAMVLGNIAYAHMLVGRYEEAAGLLASLEAVARRMGLKHTIAGVQHNLGLALARAGRIAEAREAERAALDLLVAQGNARVAAGARAYLASILAAQGELGAAEREALVAAETPHPSPSVRALTLATLADVRLARGRVREALEAAEQAAAILEPLVSDENEILVRVTLARALRACGEVERARDAIRVTRERLAARASCIGDPELRASFLERVPENAAARALAVELLDASSPSGRGGG
jgi:tetratricopeptide (TPR) repeat protein